MRHLDTNIVSAYFRGHAAVEERIQSSLDDIAVSIFVVAELKFGARKSARPDVNLARVDAFLALVTVATFDAAGADAYSQIRLDLERKGRPSSDMDMLIASVALAHSATLVTHNVKHFEAIDDLTVEDWLSH
jgi:tRNA(fMet)-specific endonuclease VapC